MNNVELNMSLAYIDMLGRECVHTKSMPEVTLERATEIVSKDINTFLAFNHKTPVSIQISIK